MVILVVSSSVLVTLPLVIVGFALAYQAYSVVHGIVLVIGTIIFIAEIVACCAIMVEKIKNCFSWDKTTTIYDIILSLIASMLFLFVSYLFVCDIGKYDNSILGMIQFFLGLMFAGFPWLIALMGWGGAVLEEEFSFSGFLFELLGAGVILFLAYG